MGVKARSNSPEFVSFTTPDSGPRLIAALHSTQVIGNATAEAKFHSLPDVFHIYTIEMGVNDAFMSMPSVRKLAIGTVVAPLIVPV